MGRLDGKVAIVTGAASGIGLATAERFADEGATVVMVDRGEDDVRRAAGGRERRDPFRADITSSADLAALRDHVAATYGHADILLANAGIAAFQKVGEVTEDVFDRIIAVNIKGTFFTVQTLLPVLRDGASVILTSSMSANRSLPAFGVYSLTKAAIRSMARSITVDLKDRRIRANALAPGIIETPIGLNAGQTAAENSAFIDDTRHVTPLGRNGQADDVAAAALYLASDDSAFVAGAELLVDGGFTQV